MKVRELLDNLQGLDPEAEVMVETGGLTWPVLELEEGAFPATGKGWMMVRGTPVWGQNRGVRRKWQR